VFSKYDNIMLREHSFYIPLCKQFLLDSDAYQFAHSYVKLYKQILTASHERKTQLFEEIRSGLEGNLPVQIEIEFILAKTEFLLANRSKALDALLHIYELVKKHKLQMRK